jgi:tetratricopeptide (TPR) repeat protein
MADIVQCPRCQRRLTLPEEARGRQVQCPGCRTAFAAAPTAQVVTEPEPERPRPRRPVPRDDHDDYGLDRSARPQPGRRRWGHNDPPPPRRSRAGFVVAGVVILAVVGIAVVFFRAAAPSDPPRQAFFPENREQRRQEIQQAFVEDKDKQRFPVQPPEKKQPDPARPDRAAELKAFFAELGRAFVARDVNRIADHWDTERLVDELLAQKVVPEWVFANRAKSARELDKGMRGPLAPGSFLMSWTESDIRHTKILGDDEVVVIVRHKGPDNESLKMRWWLVRRQGVWKVYDNEDLDLAMRMTSIVGSMIAQGAGNVQKATRATTHLAKAVTALTTANNPDAADAELKQLDGVQLPPFLEALRLVVTARVKLFRNKGKDALELLDRAHAVHPDMPCLDYFKGVVHNNLGDGAMALKHLEAYRNLLGEDATVCHEIGESLRWLRRFPEAAAEYRKALDFAPKHGDAYLGLVRSLAPNDRRDDLAARFAHLDLPHQWFEVIAPECLQHNEHENLEAVALAMSRRDPEYASAHFHLALARARLRQPAAAVQAIRAALAKEPAALQRDHYAAEFQKEMGKVGFALEAYAVAPDPVRAFAPLAAELQRAYRIDELRRLTDEHARRAPFDPLLPLYWGAVYADEGRYRLADKAFTAGLAAAPPQAVVDQLRVSRVQARFFTGQIMSAYAEISPRAQTFPLLADLCLQNEQYAQLEQLLEAHAKNEPGSLDGLRFRYQLLLRQGRVDEGVAVFKKALTGRGKRDRKQLVSPFLLAMSDIGKALEGYRAAPDARAAFQVVAGELRGTGRRDELQQLLAEHRKQHADDPWLAFHTGEMHLQEKNWGAAVTSLREAWDRAPKGEREYFGSRYVVALYRAGRALEAYQAVAPRQATFKQLAGLMVADGKGAELEALVAAHRAHAADDPDLLHAASRAKTLLKQTAEAAELLKQACAKQTQEHRRQDYLFLWVLDMEKLDRGLEAYRGAPDRERAFESVARGLVNRKKDRELEELLREHRPTPAGAAWHHFFTGELHLLRGDVGKAEEEFAAALAATPVKDHWAYRNGLFRARIKAGKAVATWREHGGTALTFGDLAGLCQQSKDARQLASLVAARRQDDPDDPNLLMWDMEVLWLDGDHAGLLALLTRHRTTLTQQRWRWKHDSYLVRSLVKLQRGEEAVREAQAITKNRQGDRTLLVLAHAARGDAKQAAAVLEQGRTYRYLVGNCYRDADLGPILRGPGFEEFRRRFPEPAPGGFDPDDDWID